MADLIHMFAVISFLSQIFVLSSHILKIKNFEFFKQFRMWTRPIFFNCVHLVTKIFNTRLKNIDKKDTILYILTNDCAGFNEMLLLRTDVRDGHVDYLYK